MLAHSPASSPRRRRLRRRSRLVAAALALLLAPIRAHGADFAVDDTADAIDAAPGDGICAALGGGCTLRAAVIEANQFPGPDRILIPAGTFVLTLSGPPEDDALSGDLDIHDAVSIGGSGAASTVIDANGAEAGFTIFEAPTSVAQLKVIGADGFGIGTGASGTSISDCIVANNGGAGILGVANPFAVVRTGIVGNGGPGIEVYGGAVVSVEDSEIARNQSSGIAMPIHGDSITVRRTLIEENSGYGIAAWDGSLLTVDESIVRANGSDGISVAEMRAVITRTTIESNLGIGVAADYWPYASIALDSSSVIGNSAGVVFDGARLDIVSSTISGNSGGLVGGIELGGFVDPGSVRLLSSTVFGNSGTSVGGIGAIEPPPFGPGRGTWVGSEISGSIIAGNVSSAGSSDCGQLDEAAIPLAGGNLIGDSSGCSFSSAGGDQVGSPGSPIDPLLRPLGYYGGPLPTHALAPGSPAIDAGPAICPAIDQRGVARPFDGDGDSVAACDAGAFETADFDADGAGDLSDNCIAIENPGQQDADSDGVGDACDNCPSQANADQADGGGGFELPPDGVGDACDSCVRAANPREAPEFLASHPWAVLTGGQRDDDLDGYGNQCDAKFPGSLGTIVGSGDLAQFRASSGKSRASVTCGQGGFLPCAIFDLDQTGALIGSGDLARYRALSGKLPGPRCASCPLECEAGALRSCEP